MVDARSLLTDPPAHEFFPTFAPVPEPDGPVEIEGRGRYDPRNALNHLTGTEWIKWTRSWFVHNPPPRSKEEFLHPAKFPEDLIERFLLFFTKRGGWVLDPFGGTGSTLVACDRTGRNGVAVELTEKWAKIAASRTRQHVVLGDARLIPRMHLPSFDFCVSSPPYWDMLWHSRGGSNSVQKERIAAGLDPAFSEDARDLGNVRDYPGFLSQLLKIYAGVRMKLKEGAYCVVFMQNALKQRQQFFPLAWEFALGMREGGWQLCQEMIWCQRDKRLGIWGYPNTYVSNVHHHYCLVFRNPLSGWKPPPRATMLKK
ncbi:MAG: hypothetical protein Kow0069_14720 [Promethearchaeota archaeon]